MSEMIIQRESLTAIADEIRILSGTEGTMGLDAMKTNVSEANADIDSQADLIAQISAALEGKASGGGIEYEIITIPAGATSASYSLSAVTNAYGSIVGWIEVNTEDDNFGTILSFEDNLAHHITGLDVTFTTDSSPAYFNDGIITWVDGLKVITPIKLLLINDPSKTPFST